MQKATFSFHWPESGLTGTVHHVLYERKDRLFKTGPSCSVISQHNSCFTQSILLFSIFISDSLK